MLSRRQFLKLAVAVPLAAAAAPLMPREQLAAAGVDVFTYRGIPWMTDPLLEPGTILFFAPRATIDAYNVLVGPDRRFSLTFRKPQLVGRIEGITC